VGGTWLVAVAVAVGWDYWHPWWIESYWWAGLWLMPPLALRRSWPRLGFWLTAVVYPLTYALLVSGQGLQSDFHVLPVMIAAFTVTRAAMSPLLAGAVAAGSTVCLTVGRPAGLAALLDGRGAALGGGVSHLLLLGCLVLAAPVLGAVFSRLGETTASLAERNAELEALQDLRTREAVHSERTRIARDLHDVVAHHVSAIVVRAQAADQVGEDRPEVYREAVQWIGPAGREALDAMRSVVRVLHDDVPDRFLASSAAEASAPRAPLPTLSELSAVIERVRGAGLDVDARLPTVWPTVPPPVGLAVVRVAQEALTNVLVHSAATRTRLALEMVGERVVLEVSDPGPARVAVTPWRRGNGLVHMCERAAACGGSLTAAPDPGGGWAVRLEVPAGV
jgi:signal transduction histidine kinase